MRLTSFGLKENNIKDNISQSTLYKYRKFLIISPGLIFVQKAFLVGLFSGEPIFGRGLLVKWKDGSCTEVTFRQHVVTLFIHDFKLFPFPLIPHERIILNRRRSATQTDK